MLSALGELLPVAVGVALSPVPIIAAILMLLAPRARTTSLGFVVGWVVGIVVGITVFTAVSAVLPSGDDQDAAPVAGVLKLALGLGLLGLGVHQWRGQTSSDGPPTMPAWMSAIASMSFAKALGLGFLLAAVNPKNLLMAGSGGMILGGAELPLGQVVVAIAVYTVIAASTVVAPVIAYLLAADRLTAPLQALRTWLELHNAAIMAVLLVVLGITMIGKGLASF